MKKILNAFLFLLCIIGLKGLQIKAIDWEFIPKGINYISKDQFIMTETDEDVILTSYRYIKIDSSITYWLKVGSENNLNNITFKDSSYRSNKVLAEEGSWQQLTKTGTPLDYSSSIEYLRLSFKYPKASNDFLTPEQVFENLEIYFNLYDSSLFNPDSDFTYQGVDYSSYSQINSKDLRISYQTSFNLTEFENSLMAYDNYDGNITAKIIKEVDTYSAQENRVGNYLVQYSVQDEALNESTFTLNLEVYDEIPPTISGLNSYEKSVNEELSVEELKTVLGITAHDDYDGNLTDNIVIENDLYTGKENTVGEHTVTYKVADSSNNTTFFTATVIVTDSEGPVFTGENSYTVNTDETLDLEEIRLSLRAVDAVSGNCFVELHLDNYSFNKTKVGVYDVIYKASDNEGNTTYFTVTVTVKDNIPPIFMIKLNPINMATSSPLSISNVLDMTRPYYGFDTNLVYEDRALVEGENIIHLSSDNQNYELTINYIKTEKKEPSVRDSSKKLNFFERIRLFFRRIFGRLF